MRTAIFVYEPTTVRIFTSESNRVLLQMNGTGSTPLSSSNTLHLGQGIYKIESCHTVTVTGDNALVAVGLIENDKKPFPETAIPTGIAANFVGISLTQMQSFFAFADGRVLANA